MGVCGGVGFQRSGRTSGACGSYVDMRTGVAAVTQVQRTLDQAPPPPIPEYAIWNGGTKGPGATLLENGTQVRFEPDKGPAWVRCPDRFFLDSGKHAFELRCIQAPDMTNAGFSPAATSAPCDVSGLGSADATEWLVNSNDGRVAGMQCDSILPAGGVPPMAMVCPDYGTASPDVPASWYLAGHVLTFFVNLDARQMSCYINGNGFWTLDLHPTRPYAPFCTLRDGDFRDNAIVQLETGVPNYPGIVPAGYSLGWGLNLPVKE